MNKAVTDFDRQLTKWQQVIEQYLPESYPVPPVEAGGRVVEAARYSLLAGGKRIRPVLMLATAEMLGADPLAVRPFAAALEMIHTYSLIHDDLPCMDNDDLRRGNPTCHVVYGEALAVLAGDALLTQAFELVHEYGEQFGSSGWQAARILSRAAGSSGMIAGQTLDIAAEGHEINAVELEAIHTRKTGALLKAPVLVAAALAGSNEQLTSLLEQYADAIGLAFQIRDDILDVTSTPEQMGKTIGKDARDHKTTYATLYGLEGAQERLESVLAKARQSTAALQAEGLDTSFLEGLINYLATRRS